MNENLIIKPGAATDDATQIQSIVSKINASMEKLDAEIKRIIPELVQTEWSITVRDNWENYYKSDVPEAMNDMLLSAKNLNMAVDASLKYSNESDSAPLAG